MSITRKSRYYKSKYRQFVIKLAYDKDADLIKVLESCDNITVYIRALLASDIRKER